MHQIKRDEQGKALNEDAVWADYETTAANEMTQLMTYKNELTT